MGKNTNVYRIIDRQALGFLQPIKVHGDKLRRIFLQFLGVGHGNPPVILPEGTENRQIHRLSGKAAGKGTVSGSLRQGGCRLRGEKRLPVGGRHLGKPEGFFVEDRPEGRGQIPRHHLHELHIHQSAPGFQRQILAHSGYILRTQMVLKQTAIAACCQHHRPGGNVAKLLLFGKNGSADRPLILDQVQCLPAGEEANLLLLQFPSKHLPDGIEFNAVPVPVLVVKAGYKLLLPRLIGPAETNALFPEIFNGRGNAPHKGFHQLGICHALTDPQNGLGQIFFVRLVLRANESQAPGAGIEAGAGKEGPLAGKYDPGPQLGGPKGGTDTGNAGAQHQNITIGCFF